MFSQHQNARLIHLVCEELIIVNWFWFFNLPPPPPPPPPPNSELCGGGGELFGSQKILEGVGGLFILRVESIWGKLPK